MGVDAEIYVDLKQRVGGQELAELNALALAEFGEDMFCIFEPSDAPLMRAEPDFPLWPYAAKTDVLRANIFWRYFGEGYERGPGDKIVRLAQWLERTTKGVVWYGSDNDAKLWVFGTSEQDKMLALWRAHVSAGTVRCDDTCQYSRAYADGARAQERDTIQSAMSRLDDGAKSQDLYNHLVRRLHALENGAEPSCLEPS